MQAWTALRDALLGGSTAASDVPRLPPELVLTIIQLAAEHPWDETSARIRRATLTSCSRVSREWRYIAQGILYEDIKINYRSRLTSLISTLESSPGCLAPTVRKLTAEGSKSSWEWSETMRDLVLLCPNLEELNLMRVIGINFTDLAQCQNLKRLSAIRCIFRPLPKPVDIQTSSRGGADSPSNDDTPSLSLVHFDLGSTTLPAGCLPPGKAFANLRALALWLGSKRLSQSEESIAQLIIQVAPHLQMLTCEDRAFRLLEPAFPTLDSLKMLDVWSFSMLDVLKGLCHPIAVLHCNCISSSIRSIEHYTAIGLLTRMLEDKPRTPALTRLRQVRISFEVEEDRKTRFADLEQACKKSKVRLVYDERPTRGSHFNTEFWRLCRELEQGLIEA